MSDLFFEIGCEELPPGAVGELSQQLAACAIELFEEHRLTPRVTHFYATPRRLVLIARGLPTAQRSEVKTITGPPVKVAFDDAGNLSKAGEGFTKKFKVSPDDVFKLKTDKGEYLAAKVAEPANLTSEVLVELLPQIISRLQYPKTMRWLEDKTSFARPIRWLVAIYNGEVVPFEFAGLKAGRFSRGHRVQGHGPHNLMTFFSDNALEFDEIDEFYSEKMFVVLDIGKRRESILKQLDDLNLSGEVVISGSWHTEAAFDHVVNSTEYPRVILGEFDAKYLSLPEQVIEGALLGYLYLFPVRSADGKLLPQFVGVHNSTREAEENVRAGLQRVTAARLADASYFWDTDTKTPLDEMVTRIDGVNFVKGLGSLGDKARRLQELAPRFGELTKMSADSIDTLTSAAGLCKADLASEMVREKEFTYLQGVMGSLYAGAAGADDAISSAIAEHYKPEGNQEPPTTTAGRALAIIDRADTLAGCFGIGMVPTGSKDPFGLRRAAVGICKILLEDSSGDFRLLTLNSLFEQASQNFGDIIEDKEKCVTDVTDFVINRLRQIFLDKNYRPDMVESILAIKPMNPRNTYLRLKALQEFYNKERAEFYNMAIALKRPINIVRSAEEKGISIGSMDVSLFAEDVEKKTYEAFHSFVEKMEEQMQYAYEEATESAVISDTSPNLEQSQTNEHIRDIYKEAPPSIAISGAYRKILHLMADLRPQIDTYFDTVMVMAEDKAIQANRLAFNKLLAETFLAFIDFAQLKGEEEYEVKE